MSKNYKTPKAALALPYLDDAQPASAAAVFGQPISAVKQVICFGCWEKSSSLKRCQACMRVSYCSKSCQGDDWHHGGHKKSCKALAACNETKTQVSPENRSWDIYMQEKKQEIDQYTSKPSYDEVTLRLIKFEPYCCHCFRTSFQLKHGQSLKTCGSCDIEFFCPDCPQTHDDLECNTLELLGLNDHYATACALNKSPMMKIVTKPKDTYVPLSTVKTWYDFYIEVSGRNELRNMATSEWKLQSQDETLKMKVGQLTGGTKYTSSILTIIAALEAAFPNLASKTSLTLDLIGARTIEFDSMYCMEELLHLLPAVKTLELVFIGPDIPPQTAFYSGLGRAQNIHHDCTSCKSQNRTMTQTLWKETYERYIQRPQYSKPDLATAFHTGLADPGLNPQWDPTIRHLVKAPHPTVFTCYCITELNFEIHNMKGPYGAKFLQTGEVNKWKTLRPRLHVGSTEMGITEYSQRISYHNYYWYIIRGST